MGGAAQTVRFIIEPVQVQISPPPPSLPFQLQAAIYQGATTSPRGKLLIVSVIQVDTAAVRDKASKIFFIHPAHHKVRCVAYPAWQSHYSIHASKKNTLMLIEVQNGRVAARFEPGTCIFWQGLWSTAPLDPPSPASPMSYSIFYNSRWHFSGYSSYLLWRFYVPYFKAVFKDVQAVEKVLFLCNRVD